MHHEFEASGPQQVHVELQSGEVEVEAGEDLRLVVDVDGDRAEDVRVERTDTGLAIFGPRRAGFFSSVGDLRVRLRVPVDSDLSTKLGSAGVLGRGRLGTVSLSTGSGDIELEEVATVEVRTGSGDLRVGEVLADADIKAGSGDVRLRSIGGAARIVTGSGNIEIGDGQGAISLKSGSGDLSVGATAGEASLSTASGDLSIARVDRGKVQLRNVSGDIRLGIAAGIPVWTDVQSTTGRVRSALPPLGPPHDGQDYVEVRASSVSGDIDLVQA